MSFKVNTPLSLSLKLVIAQSTLKRLSIYPSFLKSKALECPPFSEREVKAADALMEAAGSGRGTEGEQTAGRHRPRAWTQGSISSSTFQSMGIAFERKIYL